MGRVSLAKYGFVRTPKKDFTYEGERYYQSKAIFNNCEIRSSMCNHHNGYVARNFYIEKVNGKSMSDVDSSTRNMWYVLEDKADLKRFDETWECLYTQSAVDEFMENLYSLTATLSQIVG